MDHNSSSPNSDTYSEKTKNIFMITANSLAGEALEALELFHTKMFSALEKLVPKRI